MIGLLEALLAFAGFCAVVALCAVFVASWFERSRASAAELQLDPYREGLDATARISALAFEAAQAMHQAADHARREE
ncbi:MAG TPA: hypothetical protein VF545_03045 [Thermoleophilaceae bacterium]|jgi:hypothetical protein